MEHARVESVMAAVQRESGSGCAQDDPRDSGRECRSICLGVVGLEFSHGLLLITAIMR
jgi:hypothetical protein